MLRKLLLASIPAVAVAAALLTTSESRADAVSPDAVQTLSGMSIESTVGASINSNVELAGGRHRHGRHFHIGHRHGGWRHGGWHQGHWHSRPYYRSYRGYGGYYGGYYPYYGCYGNGYGYGYGGWGSGYWCY